MPHYRYTAIDRQGRRIAGEVEGDSREDVLRRLSGRGDFPITADEVSSASGTLRRQRGSRGQVALFVRQLATMLNAGVSLPQAIALFEGELRTGSSAWRMASQVRQGIGSGKSLAEALQSTGGFFPLVLINMVQAAEVAGTLAETLERAAATMEREQKLKAKIISSLLYPSLLIATAVAALIIILLVVVPQLKGMLMEAPGARSPALSSLVAVSDWLQTYAVHAGLGLMGLVVLVTILARRPGVRAALDALLLRLPLAGSLLRAALTVRFCRTLGTLLGSGVGLPDALKLTGDVMGNAQAAEIVGALNAEIRKGSDLTRPMEKSWLFPPEVIAVVRVGEETGRLAPSMLYLADRFEDRLDITAQRLVSVLEPAIIIGVSIVIGAIVTVIMGAVISVYDVAV